jgi:hypothetical protein
MLKKFIFLVVFLIASISNLFSQATDEDLQLNTITTSLPFMSITPDSRSGAMGDVGAALSGTSSSVYWNSAMLNFAEKDAEISLSYTPWLRQLTNDIHLSYVSGYKKLGKRQAFGASLRYFSLGSITYTDASANYIREDKPNEFELTGVYALKLSDKISVGVNGKFAYSNLTSGLPIQGVETKAGVAGAADVTFAYYDEQFKLGSQTGIFSFGATINNIGNKVSYSDVLSQDFIPMNLKIGSAYTNKIDAYNSFTFALDLQRLLVPTPAIYQDGQIIGGKSDDIGVISAMIQSFYDAPGQLEQDANGDYILDENGKGTVIKNSRLKEELREIMIATGIEYWYNKTFALRSGFFYEHATKGARQYFNAGVGLKFNMIQFDMSYLLPLKRNNPLAHTMRFTLRFDIGSKTNDEVVAP